MGEIMKIPASAEIRRVVVRGSSARRCEALRLQRWSRSHPGRISAPRPTPLRNSRRATTMHETPNTTPNGPGECHPRRLAGYLRAVEHQHAPLRESVQVGGVLGGVVAAVYPPYPPIATFVNLLHTAGAAPDGRLSPRDLWEPGAGMPRPPDSREGGSAVADAGRRLADFVRCSVDLVTPPRSPASGVS